MSEKSTSVVDANVIVTLLLGGDRVHFERARAYFELVREGAASAYISAAVLAKSISPHTPYNTNAARNLGLLH